MDHLMGIFPVLRFWDVYPGILDPDLDPTIFCHPGSRSREEQNKPIFFSPDQMISIVNVHTKFNFSFSSIFLKRKKLKNLSISFSKI
jgi:hypothetical protein